jgi:hypothetical protein
MTRIPSALPGKLKRTELESGGIGPQYDHCLLDLSESKPANRRNSGRFLADEEREITDAARSGQAHFPGCRLSAVAGAER